LWYGLSRRNRFVTPGLTPVRADHIKLRHAAACA
jgi:hypothetical protein